MYILAMKIFGGVSPREGSTWTGRGIKGGESLDMLGGGPGRGTQSVREEFTLGKVIGPKKKYTGASLSGWKRNEC